jgi:hypothetical protein
MFWKKYCQRFGRWLVADENIGNVNTASNSYLMADVVGYELYYEFYEIATSKVKLK